MKSQNVTVGQEAIVYFTGSQKHFSVGTVEKVLKNGLVVRCENRSIRFSACGVEFAPKSGLGCTVDLEWKSGTAAEVVATLNSQLEAQAKNLAKLEAKWASEGI